MPSHNRPQSTILVHLCICLRSEGIMVKHFWQVPGCCLFFDWFGAAFFFLVWMRLGPMCLTIQSRANPQAINIRGQWRVSGRRMWLLVLKMLGCKHWWGTYTCGPLFKATLWCGRTDLPPVPIAKANSLSVSAALTLPLQGVTVVNLGRAEWNSTKNATGCFETDTCIQLSSLQKILDRDDNSLLNKLIKIFAVQAATHLRDQFGFHLGANRVQNTPANWFSILVFANKAHPRMMGDGKKLSSAISVSQQECWCSTVVPWSDIQERHSESTDPREKHRETLDSM